MSELELSPSGLERIAVPGRYGARTDSPGVVIAPRSDLALATVMVRAGKLADLSAQVAAVFGIELPKTPKRIDGEAVSFVWAGPGQWLAMAAGAAPDAFARNLRRDFAGLASVTDQSDGRAIIRAGGPMMRQALAKGIPIDLDPVSFGPGDTALTTAGHITMQFWQLDDVPTYEFAVFRSFAAAFCEWLKEAGAEFGVTVAEHGTRK